MAHQRKVIRAAVAQALIDAATAAGSRVYASRRPPVRRHELPAICVYTLEESVAAGSSATAPRELERELELKVEAWIKVTQAEAADDAIDDLAEEIEAAMHADPYFGGACADSILASSEMELVEDGDRMLGWIALTYSVTYYDLAPAAPVVVDFYTAGVDYSLAGEQAAADRASDLVTVQEPAPDAPLGFGTDGFGDDSFGE